MSEIIGYVAEIAEVLVIVGLVFYVDALRKRIEKLESKED